MHNKSLIALKKPLKLGSLFLLLIITTCFGTSVSKHVQFSTTPIDKFTQQISIFFDLPKKDFIYQEFITFSTDNPAVTLSQWNADITPVNYYDPLFKNTKYIFNKSFIITISATTSVPIEQTVNFFCSYYQKSEKKINQCIFPLSFTQEPPSPLLPTHIDAHNSPMPTKLKMIHNSPLDDYLITVITTIAYIAQSLTITRNMHLFFILLLISLSASFWFFYRKPSIQGMLAEATKLLGLTCGFILLGYTIHYIQTIILSTLLIPIPAIYTLTIGVFYIKKSTTLHLKVLCTLCSLAGLLLIISAIFLSFKAIQAFYP